MVLWWPVWRCRGSGSGGGEGGEDVESELLVEMMVEVVGEQETWWVNKWDFYSYFLYLLFFNWENRVTFIIKQKLLNSLI